MSTTTLALAAPASTVASSPPHQHHHHHHHHLHHDSSPSTAPPALHDLLCFTALSRADTALLSAVAAATVALVVATAMHAAEAAPTAPDELVGYVLLVIGYMLLPALGVMLVRRNRELQQTRLLLSQAVTEESSAPRATTGRPRVGDDAGASGEKEWRDVRCAAQRGLFFARAAPDARALARDVDAAAPVSECGPAGAHCAVCLCDIDEGDAVRRLPCAHAFHPACAELWLVTARKNSCPLCAAEVCPNRDASMRASR